MRRRAHAGHIPPSLHLRARLGGKEDSEVRFGGRSAIGHSPWTRSVIVVTKETPTTVTRRKEIKMSRQYLGPYINFGGRAREAMEFYRKVLGGNLDLQTLTKQGACKPAGP